jgi:hypothetical protein
VLWARETTGCTALLLRVSDVNAISAHMSTGIRLNSDARETLTYSTTGDSSEGKAIRAHMSDKIT